MPGRCREDSQFKGMRMGPALEAYLKARPGYKIPINRVVEDLRVGGAELGQRPERHRQHLKVTMLSRPKQVQFNPETWEMWLAPTAGEPPKPRIRPPKKKQ